jgi:hypothetical protein
MKRRAALPVLISVGAAVTSAAPAFAQSCGGSSGPSLAASGTSPGAWLDKGRASLRLSEEYEVKDRSYKGSRRVDNDFDESIFISRTALELRYGVTDDWTAGLTATYPHFTYRLKPPGGERIKQRFRGPGDTFLSLGRRIHWDDDPDESSAAECAPDSMADGHQSMDHGGAPSAAPLLSFWGGVSLPTGSPEEPDPARVTQDVSVSNLQTGTGTFDPFVRARIEWPKGRFSLFAEAAVLFPLYENRHDYRTADAEALVAGASTPVAPKLEASLAAMFQRTGRDEFRGDNVGVGGARTAYLVPGLSWRLTDAASLDVGVRLAVYRRTQTKLSDSDAVFQIALTYTF